MQKEYQLVVDIEKKILTPSFEVNTLDLKTIKLKITITKGMTLVDLTDITVRMSIRKPDGNVLFQDCQVVNAKGGQVEIILENQAYVLPGSYSAEIMCFKGTDKVAVTGSFSYRSIKGIMDDKAVESKSEFTAITKQLNVVQATVNDLRKNGTGIDAQARQGVEQVTEQLADNAVKPESFNGNDFQKLQQAFDTAISQQRPLQISKTYDLKGDTIVINKASDRRFPTFIYGGGTIIKSQPGFMFTAVNIAVSDLSFSGINFKGVEGVNVKVFDNGNGKLIRINTSNCYFSYLHTVFYTENYLQTIKNYQDTFIRISNAVYDCGGSYDVVVDNILFEMSPGSFYIDRSTGTHSGCFNLRIKNSCLEGSYGTTPILFIKTAHSLSVADCYFEQNKGGNIHFDPNAELRNVKISGCSLFGSPPGIPLIKWGGTTYNCEVSNNFSSVDVVNDFTNVKNSGYKIVISNQFYYNVQKTRDIGGHDGIVYYKDINKEISGNEQAIDSINPSLFKEMLVALSNDNITPYKNNYVELFNSGLVMGGLSLAIRGYDFPNSSNITSIADKSGMNKTGILSGFARTPESGSDGNGGIVFSNTRDNFISFPNTDFDEMTIEYVFELLTSPTVNSGLLGCSAYNDSGYLLGLVNGNKLYFAVQNTLQSNVASNKILDVGSKYVVQIRYSTLRKEISMFVNGVFDNKYSSPVTFKNLSNKGLFVGKDRQWATSVNHKMYALNVYNRYLTDNELFNNYNVIRN